MINEGLHYATFVLFIRSPADELQSTRNVDRIMSRFRAAFNALGYEPKAYGTIIGPQGIAKPKVGILSVEKLTEWSNLIEAAYDVRMLLCNLETSMKGMLPNVFASFTSSWPRDMKPSKTGADYCLSFAADMQAKANVASVVESLLKEFAGEWEVINGAFESDVRWDRPSGHGTSRQWMFDLRYSECQGGHYITEYDMDQHLTRLFLGNVFTSKHLACSGVGDIPSGYIAELVSFGDRYYCRFVIDPQDDPEFNAKVEPFFNVIPPEKRRPMRRDPK